MHLRKNTQIPIIPKEVVDLLTDVSKSMFRSSKQQQQCLQMFLQTYVEQESTIKHLTENPHEITKLLDSLTQMLKEIMPQLPAKFKKAATAYTAFSLLGSAAAQSNNLNVVTGQVGGNNLCSNFLHCVQGALVNANGTVIASFNAFLDLADKINLGATWAFDSGMRVQTLGNILKDIFNQNQSSVGEVTIVSPCAKDYYPGNSMPGGHVGSQVHSLNVNQCLAYGNGFVAEAQKAMADGRIGGLNWAVGTIIVAAIVLCMVAAYCCYCCCTNKSKLR